MFASLYDWLCWPLEIVFLRKIRRELCAPLRGKILEIGAGTGANFRYYDSSAYVVALEPEHDMLRRALAQSRTAQAKVEVIAKYDDYLDRLPPHSIDAVVVTLVLCSVDDPQMTLARIKRVLKAGGTFAFLEHVRGNGFTGRLQDRAAPFWSAFAQGCRLNRPTLALIGDAGFDTRAAARRRVPGVLISDIVYGSVKAAA